MSSKHLAEKLIESINLSFNLLEYSFGDVTKILVTEKYDPNFVYEVMPVREFNVLKDNAIPFNTLSTHRYSSDYRCKYEFELSTPDRIGFFVNFLYNEYYDDFIIYIGASHNIILKNLIKDLREITKLTVEVM